MKTFLLLPCLLLLATTNLSAQELKDPAPIKKNYIGLSFRGGWGRSFGFIADTEFRYGRFVSPQWLVGAAIDVRRSNRFDQQAFGGFVRYYFNKNQRRFFVEASHKLGTVDYKVLDGLSGSLLDSSSGTMMNSFIGVGYAFVNKKNFGVEFFAGWEATKYDLERTTFTIRPDMIDSGVTTGIRFQYRFK